MGENGDDKKNQAGQLFENFIQATTCKGTLQAFNILTRQLELDPQDHRHFYTKLKSKVTSWKAKALWSKLDKRNSPKEYKKGKACVATKCLIIGGGPCGLRTAIELSCLGAKVVVVEKRDTFSRNNVLHLWPYTIHDLRCLGAKKFYGKFCAGAIDHISIWQLQLMLFKIALLHGIEIHVNVEFVKLLTPPEDQENQKIGWRAEFLPQDHPLSEYEFDVIIGADGRRNTLEGFRRKEFRGKLAIAITANFINRNTTAEAKVEEISGVAFIFNQKFFQDLKEETGIDLENIVYYKDSTHYFVMTAKKQSLLDKGVIIDDYIDAEMLLCAENVNQDHLQSYAREAADFATNYQLPSLDFSINHYEQPDVAMFDFTSMYASENAALVRERYGHHLLVALVGDSLLEPFWPMGTGCARGFLAAFDTAWMVRSWAQGNPPLEIIAERESLYRLLPQTTPENISKNFDQYTIDPGTRYPNLNSSCVRPHQVKHLFITNELQSNPLERASSIRRSVGLSRRESDIRPNKLLTWCQKQTEGYSNVAVTNLTTSWKSGLALCAIIHHFRPDLIDFSSLNEEDTVRNNQLAFDIAEREFGISPITTGKEMASTREPDKLGMVLYLSKFYELFRGTPLRTVDTASKDNGENGDAYSSKPSNLLVNNYLNLTLPRKRVPKVEKKSEENDRNKRRREGLRCFEEPASFPSQSISAGNECSDTREVINQNKVKSMATQLLAKFEENAPNTSLRRQGSFRKEFPPNIGGSDICYFCKRRVYVVERLSAEGHFFHRECFKCAYCSTTLRLGNYVFNMAEGKFYCQPHFMYSFSNNKQRKRRTDSKIQEEDKMWKNEEPQLVGITTDSPDSASSSSEESSPDEPTSPKKSRSDLKPGGFQRRNSSASTDWKSVKIAPEEEMAEHNLLAVRVMVLSDGSSSDMEFDTPGDTPNSNGREVPGLSPPPIMHKEPIGDPPNNSDVKQEQKPAYSPTDALLRASSFQSVASNKPQRWRKSIQSTFPLFFGKKSVHLSRENSSSPVSSPDDEVFCSNVYSGHFETTHPLFNKSEQVLETTYVGIPSYVPHHEGLLNNSSLLTHTEPGTSRTRKPSANGQLSHYRGEMDRSREGHVDVHSPLPGYVSDCTEVFEDTTDDIRQDETLEQESKNGKNPTLKKLVLSKEEKSTLLDWNYAKPEIPVEKRGEQASSQVTHNPGKESESKSKSPFRILGVIKRSLTRSVSSVSENTTNISHFKAKPVPPSNHFDISSPFGNDIAFRRSQSSTGCPTRPDGKEMNLFISNHPTSSVTHNESLPHDFKAWDDGVPWKTGQDRPALSSEKPKRAYSSNTKIEDVMPKLLEKFTIKENHCSSPTHDLPFRNRKNSFFSSLRLKSKEPENGLSENAPRNDTWRVFGSIRKKGNETESSETSPKRAENVLHNPLPVQRSGPPCKPGRTAVSEQYSSSSDEECKPKRSTSLNATRTSKSRKKMKREAKQKAKQEELKRLHKAQQIQRQLQEVEEKQRALEIKGVKLEKALRGESDSATQDEAQLLYEWFQLALEKNKLNHYESELLFVAKGLDLEDQQGRLEQKLRDRMLVESSLKGETDIQEEGEIFAEMMRVIEQRDQLVSYIEEQRLRENTQDKNSIQLPKDCQLKMDIFNNKIMI
ncbi:F-actin-monooxygenase MICAL2 isoform X10 [Ascaphus truei]|uniref:F-actin-monooxygenase MICAL2 isoform X10 n=1 Tax=Ascaphus truei TaxID=8439 RepID=UPI003F5A1FCF